MKKIPFVKMHGLGNDFVIIAENPLTIQPNQIHNIHIVQTWVNGLMVYKSAL